MKPSGIKIRLVVLPLLYLAIIFFIAYSALYWIIHIQFQVDFLKEDIIHYWMPLGFGFVSVLFFIRPRVHLLKLDRDNGRIRTLYYMVGAAVFCIPTIIMLNYLDSATGKLTNLTSIKEISQRSKTKYYKVNTYVLDKSHAGIKSRIKYEGKHNEHFNFDIFIAVPVISQDGDTLQSPSAFLSVKYHKQISSKISDAERSFQWDSFWDESFEAFDKDELRFIFLDRISNSSDRDYFISAAQKCLLYKDDSEVIILRPLDKPFEERNGHQLDYIFLSFLIGAIVWLLMVLIPGIHEYESKKFNSEEKDILKKQIIKTFQEIKPRQRFEVTPILIFLNILVFIIMVFLGYGFVDFDSRDLVRMGAMFEPGFKESDWWRFFTSMFLHGGLFHLLMNMISLYLAGIFLEPAIGTKKFWIYYFVSGIGAGMASLWWHDDPFVAIGASGAIFGLYGVLLSMMFFKRIDKGYKRSMLVLLACTAGYSLVMGFLSKGIDNSAHIGGLISGFSLGIFFIKKANEET